MMLQRLVPVSGTQITCVTSTKQSLKLMKPQSSEPPWGGSFVGHPVNSSGGGGCQVRGAPDPAQSPPTPSRGVGGPHHAARSPSPLPAGPGAAQAEVDAVQALVRTGALAALVPALRMAHALKRQALLSATPALPQSHPVPEALCGGQEELPERTGWGGALRVCTAGPQAWASTPRHGHPPQGAVALVEVSITGSEAPDQGSPRQEGQRQVGTQTCGERDAERDEKRNPDGDSEAGNHLLGAAPASRRWDWPVTLLSVPKDEVTWSGEGVGAAADTRR